MDAVGIKRTHGRGNPRAEIKTSEEIAREIAKEKREELGRQREFRIEGNYDSENGNGNLDGVRVRIIYDTAEGETYLIYSLGEPAHLGTMIDMTVR